MIELTLPWPPTVNTYWRHVNGQMLISRRGREYRESVKNIVLGEWSLGLLDDELPLKGRLYISVCAHPPDNRKRDLDNLLKSLLDSLEHAAVYNDDGQIDQLSITRAEERTGEVHVKVGVL